MEEPADGSAATGAMPGDAPGSPVRSAGGLTAAAVLGDGLRGQLFEFIRRARRPITRDEAAAQVGISRKLAAFHLDKLVAARLLRAGYAAPPGIRRVGRAPKVYEAAAVEVRVTIPERRAELLADILVDAVRTEREDEDARHAALRVAHERGRLLGAGERARLRTGRLGTERALTVSGALLEEQGFEPERTTPTRLRLRNCPFHPLAARAPDLVCGINHAYLSGLVDGLDTSAVTAVLAPRAGECCVELCTPVRAPT